MSSAPRLDLGVVGATGKMGACLLALAGERGVPVVLSAHRGGWHATGRPEVLIDVSHPRALSEVIVYCRREGVALVEGTSGLSVEGEQALADLAGEVPVVAAANFALGHHLQSELLACLAEHFRRLPERRPCEVAVVDRHPATKADRISATARALAARWQAESGAPPDSVSALRLGLPVGHHTVAFTLPGEDLRIEHGVTDRRAAAWGALAAAAWVHGRAPGRFSMADVYGSSAGPGARPATAPAAGSARAAVSFARS